MVSHLAGATDIVRLSLHVLAATIWVGGQFVLAGLVPTLRSLGDDAPRRAARVFARLSWPAFVVLLITGMWNQSVSHHPTAAWTAVLNIKVGFVVVAGLFTYVHTKAASKALKGASAGLGAVASVIALVLGVALSG